MRKSVHESQIGMRCLETLGIRTDRRADCGGEYGPAIVLLRVGQHRDLDHEAIACLYRGWGRLGGTSPPRTSRRAGGSHDTIAHGMIPPAGGLSGPVLGTHTPRSPLRYPPHTHTSARGHAARVLPQLRSPALGRWYTCGFAAGPVGSHARRQSAVPPERPFHHCTRPPRAGAPWAHANAGGPRPASVRTSPPTGAKRVAGAPRLRGPAGWHRCAGLTSRARSGAPDTSPRYGDSRLCCLPRSRELPQGPTPDILRSPQAFPHSHSGCHPARRPAGAARHRHSPPDAGALV